MAKPAPQREGGPEPGRPRGVGAVHWHELRHEGACRLLADGVDIRII
jgi:hypothetical protein